MSNAQKVVVEKATQGRTQNRAKTPLRSFGKALFFIGFIGLGTACSSTPLDYTWTHPMGGEYLFAYDRAACTDRHTDVSDAAFFSCMKDLGYVLIDPASGQPLASVETQPAALDVSAAR